MEDGLREFNRKAALWVQSQPWWTHGEIDPDQPLSIEPATEVNSGSTLTGDWTEEFWEVRATPKGGHRATVEVDRFKYPLGFGDIIRGIVSQGD